MMKRPILIVALALLLGQSCVSSGGGAAQPPSQSPAAGEAPEAPSAEGELAVPTEVPVEAPTAAPTEAPTQTPEPTLKPTDAMTPTPEFTIGSTRASEVDGMVQVYVPEGAFIMGYESPEFFDAMPPHEVWLDAFWIDQTEVTVAMFAQYVDATGYITEAELAGQAPVFDAKSDSWRDILGANWKSPDVSSEKDKTNHPVVHVSWNDAAAYCEWAGRRLPTEAEWEKSARGTDQRIYPWGDEINCDQANYAYNFENYVDREYCLGDTSEVGSYPAGASPYGALDMAGNVKEWTQDWYLFEYYEASPDRNPPGPDSGERKVFRGGAWYNDNKEVKAYKRWGWSGPSFFDSTIGFRCAASP